MKVSENKLFWHVPAPCFAHHALPCFPCKGKVGNFLDWLSSAVLSKRCPSELPVRKNVSVSSDFPPEVTTWFS